VQCDTWAVAKDKPVRQKRQTTPVATTRPGKTEQGMYEKRAIMSFLSAHFK
jgi:hypothetical protein